jgi:DNA-binding response OmpR family regulator
MRKIAIVEDDPDELARLTAILSDHGPCVPFNDGQSFLMALHRDTFDLACIDWNLPRMTGVELIKRIRGGAQAPQMPIILITARSADEDVVNGLVSGADDYVTKPVRKAVLLARVETLLRRLAPPPADPMERFGDYVFDRSRDVVIAQGKECVLTTKEFNLALLLFRNMHRPLARRYLMEEVWGATADISSRTLDTHVCRLKTKLGLSPANGYSFGPVYGFGYRLEKIGSSASAEVLAR